MQTDHVLGASCHEAISSMSSAEVLVARIAPGFITCPSSAKDRFLEVHVFEHRLDHQITLGQFRKA